jgi:hypothetical protein
MQGWGENAFGIYWYGDPTGFDPTQLTEVPIISVQKIESQISRPALLTDEENSITNITITNVGS